MDASELLVTVGLKPQGPVLWGDRVPFGGPGVYVVQAPTRLSIAPIDHSEVSVWIERVPTIKVDGHSPTTESLALRLATFWLPDEDVVYIGRAGTSLATRVGQYYRTPLGNSRPHAGGHWIKTLAGLENFRVWWAASDDATRSERSLLTAFGRQHGDPGALPFANWQGATGLRKPHGITSSTLAPAGRTRRPEIRTTAGSRKTAPRQDLVTINAALQRLACALSERSIRAVEAAQELDRLGLLADSTPRPGKPLRDLLRTGDIGGAVREDGRWWVISCLDPDRS